MNFGSQFDPTALNFMPGSGANPIGAAPGMSMANMNPTQDFSTFMNPASSAGAAAPGFSTGLGANLGTAQLGLAGLGSIASLWSAFQAQGLAKKQFDFTKSVTNTNLRNQAQSYNTGLEDRIRSRTAVEGGSAADAEDYLRKNRLSS